MCPLKRGRFSYCLRLKSSPTALDELIAFSKSVTQNWWVDFNASLEFGAWERFISDADLSRCLYIEQPFAIGTIPNSLPKSLPRLLADEDLAVVGQKEIQATPYSGVILKAVRHDLPAFIDWIHFSQGAGLSSVSGGMVCDKVGADLVELFNNSMSVCAESDETHLFFNESVHAPAERTYKIEADGSVSVNPDAIEWVRESYTLQKVVRVVGASSDLH